jgi:hypothetical protein
VILDSSGGFRLGKISWDEARQRIINSVEIGQCATTSRGY